LWYVPKEKSEMTTLLQEFEEWLREQERNSIIVDDILVESIKKLEELKEKHHIEKWSMPEEEFRWLAFMAEYNALKEKYAISR
jgi:hypothetical protein